MPKSKKTSTRQSRSSSAQELKILLTVNDSSKGKEMAEALGEATKGIPDVSSVLKSAANPSAALTVGLGATAQHAIEFSAAMDELKNHPAPDWSTPTTGPENLKDAQGSVNESLAATNRELDRIANRDKGPEPTKEGLKTTAEAAAAAQAAFSKNENKIATNEENLAKGLEERKRLQDALTEAQTSLQSFDSFFGDLDPLSSINKNKAKKTIAELEEQSKTNDANISHFKKNISDGDATRSELKEKAAAATESFEEMRAIILDQAHGVSQRKESPTDRGVGYDSGSQQVSDALGKASDANKNLIDAPKKFEATADAIKTYSTAIKQKLEQVAATLEAQGKAIQELRSSRQSGMPIPNP